MTAQALWLMAALLVAHYLGDFTPLATVRMQEAKANGGPLRPIAAHALVHTFLVTAIVAVLVGTAGALLAAVAALEFGTHFALDAFRARLGRRVPAFKDPGRNSFWYMLGADQLAHGLVLVGVAALAL